MAYKQQIIPEILTSSSAFKNLSRNKLKVFTEAYYHKNIKGTSVINQHLGLTILFTEDGKRKLTHGSALYPNKAIALIKLREMLRYAEYSNFGARKATDPKTLRGYLNFKVKCRIDGHVKNFHLTVKLFNNNKAYYCHELNQVKKKPRP
jgi:hypothetical protein